MERLMTELEEMLRHHSFKELLQSGGILNVESARKRLGLTAWGLRRLCRRKKVGHFMREGRYFFLRSQVNAVFEIVVPEPETGL